MSLVPRRSSIGAFVVLLASPAAGFAAAGDLDPTFGAGGIVITDLGGAEGGGPVAPSLALQPDGRILLAGTSDRGGDSDFAIVRYEPDGGLDLSFGDAGSVVLDLGQEDLANSVAVQDDGKILVAGSTGSGPVTDFAVVRLMPDGSRDSSFGSGGIVVTDLDERDTGLEIVVLPDGRMVVVGQSSGPPSHVFAVAMARYLPDGSLDPSFDGDGLVVFPGGPTYSTAFSAVLLPDGDLLAIGSVETDFAVMRFNDDGSLDGTFGFGGVATTDLGGSEIGLAGGVQPGGRIVIGGPVTGTPDFALVGFGPDGALDPTFGTGGVTTTDFGDSLDIARSLAIQRNGKIVVGGSTSGPGGSFFALARYLADGHLDPRFGAGGLVITDLGGEASGNAVAVQPDGRILLAGTSDRDFAIVRYVAEARVLEIPTTSFLGLCILALTLGLVGLRFVRLTSVP